MKHLHMEFAKPDYFVEEAYKTLRTNLQFCGNEKKVINITSCMASEGKSTVSLLLARSLSEVGKRVLLIDADMRKSAFWGTLTAAVHEQKIYGLSHFLSGQASLEEVLYQLENTPGMYMIFSGTFPPNPSELLENSKFKDLLEASRKQFDYILVDTPPLGAVIDSAVIASKSDGSILVIEANVVGRELAADIMNQLKKTGCPVLGVVMNKVDMRHGEYDEKYIKKYYRKYSEGRNT